MKDIVGEVTRLDTIILQKVYSEARKELSYRKKMQERQDFFEKYRGLKGIATRLENLNRVYRLKVDNVLYKLAWISDVSCDVRASDHRDCYNNRNLPASVIDYKKNLETKIKQLCDDFEAWGDRYAKGDTFEHDSIFQTLTDYCGFEHVQDNFFSKDF